VPKNKSKSQVRIVKAQETVAKSGASTNLAPEVSRNADVWITPVLDQRGLRKMRSNSSILPQCIRAYKNNIAGFGIGVKYKEDVKETAEMKSEFTKAEEVIDLLNLDMDTKEVFEDVIEARETYGIAYLEVMRSVAGEVAEIVFIRDTPSVTKSLALPPYVEVNFHKNGNEVKRKRKFCKYKQQIGGKTVYFKEIGDPRAMSKESGEYLKDDEKLDLAEQANEIIEFAIGTEPYGEVRWIGQILGIDGSRKAENLNNRYFSEGRHTPLMITIEGGSLTDDSYDKLQEYMNGIKGESGQHAFMILETESIDGRTDIDTEQKPIIKIVKMADILQKDELFQDYLDNNRRKVQSAFQLPDLYVGYTTDFNRATSQTAMEVTEEQVFQPERKSLAWVINNILLADYKFKHVEAYFKSPNITNPDDIMKILNIVERAGGLTPNKAKEIGLRAIGETSEDYEGEWANVPLVYARVIPAVDRTEKVYDVTLGEQIEKAAANKDDQIYAVLKEISSFIRKEGHDV
jgi:PBSX family phage portal protein